MSWRVSRDRRPAAGRGRDGPGQARQPHRGATAATTRSGRTTTVSAGLDPRTARARRPAGRRSPARRTSIQPASRSAAARPVVPAACELLIRTRTRPCQRQKSTSPASGRRAVSTAVRPARIASSRAVAGGHQRVGDQAAGPQRGGNAGRQKAPRELLQGAGLEPRRGRGAHGLADAVAADRGGPRRPGRCGGRRRPGPGRRSSPSRPGRPFLSGPGRAGGVRPRSWPAGPGPAGEHVGELPGQVVRVAQPGRQALADERRGEVRESPSRKTRPVWKRDASRARNV